MSILRAPSTSSIRQRAASVQASYPAPVGGINARDSDAAMKPSDAKFMENWFPGTSDVYFRGGCEDHATGMTGNGKTLAVYNALNGTSKMFATTASGTYDVSSAGAVGASLAARTNGKHQYVNFGNGTSNYLILVNGADKPLYFDGTTWVAVDAVSTPALTGLTTTLISHVHVHKNRLYFIEKDSLSFWYLTAGAAGGALTEFDLSAFCRKGGQLMAMSTWTFDGGSGLDDYAVFATSEGEILVYSGDNPAVAASWLKVGTYDLGKPIGRRVFTPYAGDLVLVTQDGAFPMSTALKYANTDKRVALTDKIQSLFNSDARSYGSIFGWESTIYPAESAFIFNVPVTEDGTHYQYVMNTITKAWTKFTGWNAETFAVFNKQLYFCTGTKVVKAWTGTSDFGANITFTAKTAFNYFGSTRQKKVELYRPVLIANGALSFLTGVDMDFSDSQITSSASAAIGSSAIWDTSKWDEAYWSAGPEIVKSWTSPDAYPGYAAAAKIKIVSKTLTVRWLANDWIIKMGGIF